MKVYIARPPGYDNPNDVFPFVRSLLTWFEQEGIEHTATPESGEDVALGIQWVPGLDIVESLARRGVPFIHRLDGRARSLVKVYEQDEENRRINAIADWTVFQSRFVREHTTRTVETIFGPEPPICLNPQRGSIIYNGVDRRVFSQTGPRERLDGEFIVLHVAFTHNIRKGVADLVQLASALRDNPKIRFITIGRQDLDVAHGHLLRQLPNVSHLGVIVDRERLASIMRGCHVLFFPSREDYCPNTVLEAMSCGLPILFHPSGGTPELVCDQHTVAGVPMMPENPVYPLHVIREHHAEFSRRAVEMVERRFTLRHVGDAYVQLFRRLIAERRAASAPTPVLRQTA
jgi:glycosyltransferase involved in cell wall biosynthesis